MVYSSQCSAFRAVLEVASLFLSYAKVYNISPHQEQRVFLTPFGLQGEVLPKMSNLQAQPQPTEHSNNHPSPTLKLTIPYDSMLL